jgi:hypothetical protein
MKSVALTALALAALSSAEASSAEASCATMLTTFLGSTTVQEFSGIGDPSACCTLCSATTHCQAWALKGSICMLKADLSAQTFDQNATSGYLPTAATHYSPSCLADELKWKSVPGLDTGGFCSTPCTPLGGGTFCPQDVPAGANATPKCVINDPIGEGRHCALVCSADADCAAGSTCSGGATGFGKGICTYDNNPRELRIFNTDECPPGWKESALWPRGTC